MKLKKINKILLVSTIVSAVASVILTVVYIIYHSKVSGVEYVELATKSILEAYDLLHFTSVIGWWCFGVWMLTLALVIPFVIIKIVTSKRKKFAENYK